MLKELLGRPIAFHRCLAQLVGSINGAVMLGQAIYWTDRATLPDGWFYKTQEEWQEETMLTRYEQESVRKKLRTFAFWREDLRGVPATLHYRVDMLSLRACLQTSLRETSKLDAAKTANKNAGKPQTFTSSEITAEITQRKSAPAPPPPSKQVFAGNWIQITERQDRALADAFPEINRRAQYALAESWCENNPERRPKKRIGAFIHNWFQRAMNGGGNGARPTGGTAAREVLNRFEQAAKNVTGRGSGLAEALRGDAVHEGGAGDHGGSNPVLRGLPRKSA